MQFIKVFFLIFLLSTLANLKINCKVIHKTKKVNDNFKNFRFKSSLKIMRRVSRNANHDHINFIVGLAVGYGLNTEASQELKECFIRKEKHGGENIIDKFLQKVDNKHKSNNENDKQESTSFTRMALDFFAHFKDCGPLKDTILTFIKNRLINIGIKGLSYVIGGPLGLIAKGTYDTIKLTLEVKNFYNLLKQSHRDYLNLGTCVGRIIYYTQNLLLKRR